MTAPSRLTIALLGLCFAACTTGNEAPAKQDEASKTNESETPEVAPEPEPKPEIVEPEIAEPKPEPEPDPEPVADETTGAEPGEDGSVGTTDGSAVEPKPVPKPKYGAPRPSKKYGGPPPPNPDPFE